MIGKHSLTGQRAAPGSPPIVPNTAPVTANSAPATTGTLTMITNSASGANGRTLAAKG